MGNCRIKNIVRSCGYQVPGVDSIQILDFDDFNGFRFEGDGRYNNCLITDIVRTADFVDVDSPETAKYASSSQNGVYTHTLETFIGDLSAELEATLHLATKRRYIVLFRTRNGRYFVFGYEAGATVSYTNQTAEGAGALVTLTASSVYPLFEAVDDVLGSLEVLPSELLFTDDTPQELQVKASHGLKWTASINSNIF